MKGRPRPAERGRAVLYFAAITFLIAIIAAVVTVGIGMVALGGDNVLPGLILIAAGSYIAFALYRGRAK